MTTFHEKVQAQVKQIVGQMIGDHQLEQEGREQQKVDQAVRDVTPHAEAKNEPREQPVRRGSEEKE